MAPDRRGRGGRHDAQPRTVLVSKALSRLLRHAAAQERIPIDNHGYVRMDQLLAWQKLRSMKPPVTFDEVLEVVQDNEKKRFGLKYVAPSLEGAHATATQAVHSVTETNVSLEASAEPEAETETQTQRAISTFKSSPGDQNPKNFFIRATQGHSMKDIEAENLLTPITLENPASLPDAVVHGTFYGAWDKIIASGGLKRMSRNHVHFAAGPQLDDILVDLNGRQAAGVSGKGKDKIKRGLDQNKVISGMRSDAQILIYIDIRRALEEEKDMRWWKSENGVILTDGVEQASGEKVVPLKYWIAAVEVVEGIGLIWNPIGEYSELPARLRSRGLPQGKGRRGGGQTRGSDRKE